MRRVQRMMLGTPMVLRSVSSISVVGTKENLVLRAWMERFLPPLRYGNPSLDINVQVLRAAPDIAPQDVAESGEEVANDTSASSSSPSQESVTADGSEDGSEVVEAQDGSESPSLATPQEYLQLRFTDGTSHHMNLGLYRYSHQVMQRILDLDVDRGIISA
mmetsp:Transcript_57731/g.137401  ORF Transcript_57731/g.137401 Transcript_57731/m.137401 type:complete len:161 (+) Transcript_57731:97-579(+)